MVASWLSQVEALFSLKNVVLWKLNYPLVTTTLSEQQCHQIMSPILQQGLPKASVVCTFPRVLVHGPVKYGSLEIPKLYTKQIIAHITMLLRFRPEKTDLTGSLLHMTAEAMRLEVGYNGELLAAPLTLSENVTNSWMKHVWISTQSVGITVSTTFLEIPLQRNGDTAIMCLFVKSSWKQLELQTLNQC